MKLEEGMYVRTKWGINKIIEYVPQSGQLYLKTDVCVKSNVIKASHNIIDLIEVGDIITFKNDKDVYRVNCIPNKESGCECFYLEFDYADKYGVEDIRVYIEEMENDLESITTKEQFESMSYKVGE